jgi:hypothetical protein
MREKCTQSFGKENPGGKRLPGRSKCRLEDIKSDLKQVKGKCVDWIHLAHDGVPWRALVNAVNNLLVP